MAKMRADLMVVEQGLAPSRTRAQALILAGVVLDIHGNRVEKPGQNLPDNTELRLKGQPIPFVSRGGLKLEAALKAYDISVADKVCLDVGASTGGFTDCMLQRGAQKVFAVDVGYNQLVYSLRQDERVVCMERLNVRTWDPEILGEKVSLISIDVSFISLMLILESVLGAAAQPCRLVALVKPQFEVGREEVGKGGIVRNEEARQAALVRIQEEVLRLGATRVETMDSPILGTKGNHEFLLTCVFE